MVVKKRILRLSHRAWKVLTYERVLGPRCLLDSPYTHSLPKRSHL